MLRVGIAHQETDVPQAISRSCTENITTKHFWSTQQKEIIK
jgi:hypothetical protein